MLTKTRNIWNLSIIRSSINIYHANLWNPNTISHSDLWPSPISGKHDKMHTKAKMSGQNRHWENFKKMQKYAKKSLNKAYNKYLNDIMSPNLQTNPKTFNSFMSLCKTENRSIPSLHLGTDTAYTDQNKSNLFNNRFKSALTKESFPLPQAKVHPHFPLSVT